MKDNFSEKIYKEHLIELYKSPSNYGELENFTNEKTEHNSLCGDEITMQLIVKDGIVKDAKFSGSGCVMSIVSSSMITDKIKGMKIKDVKNLDKNEILKMIKVKISPGRLKCILLPLDAVKNSLK